MLGSGSGFAAAEWAPAATCCPAATLRAILAKKAASGLMLLVLLDLPMAAICPPTLVVGSRALRFHPGSSSLLRDTDCPVVVVIVIIVVDDEGNDDAHLGDEGSPLPSGLP
jgi:hypothetical protein